MTLKMCELARVPGDPAIMCPSLFKGSRSLLVLARPSLTYCVLQPYLVRQYLGFY